MVSRAVAILEPAAQRNPGLEAPAVLLVVALGEVARRPSLPPKLVGAAKQSGSSAGRALSLQEVVKGHVRRVLKETRWNKKLAAQLLGIHRRTLYRLTKRYGISLHKPQ